MFRLVYRSHSAIPAAERTAGLGEIFATARRNNRKLDVTGALMISDGAFVQVLEGDETTVRALYARIGGDDRHQDVTLLREEQVDGRTFGRWAMAKVSEGGGPDIRLLSNARAGRIVDAGADHHVSDAQQAVLTFMRGAIATA